MGSELKYTDNLIWENFEIRRQKNPRFSLRAYAKFLKISPASLSEFFSGKRSLSYQTLSKVADILSLGPQQRAAVLNTSSTKTSIVDEQTFSLIAEWQYFAILNLIEIKSFRGNTIWIAKRLGISEELARKSWEQLKQMKLVERQNGQWVRTKQRLHSSDQLSSLAVRRAHLEDLDLIRESILTEDISRRDSTSMTFPLNARQLQKMTDLIRVFRSEILQAAENIGDYTDIYKFCVHLIPLTKESETSKK